MLFAWSRLRPREWDPLNSLGCWDTSGSPNPDKENKPGVNQQKRTCHQVNIAVSLESEGK